MVEVLYFLVNKMHGDANDMHFFLFLVNPLISLVVNYSEMQEIQRRYNDEVT